ncbi:MAG: N-acetylmuramoyl-L-alanine amidase [Terriglobales bacterium]
MSANPTRVEWESPTTGDPGFPLQEGNRVLESIASREALRALLAFSDLHEQIRNRRVAAGSASDLFETERFILDEALQLICDRVQAITQADGILVALTAGSRVEELIAEKSTGKQPELVCRASAGPLAVERGGHLIGESEFLQDCLESGRILRCDDCEIDARVEIDFARQIGARSTVLVPLRGRREQLGVLQAFSRTPWAFTDHDIRCFDLFTELVLSALKPEDQDRRINWLSGVASEVLQAKPAAVAPIVVEAAIEIQEVELRKTVLETKPETGLALPPIAAIQEAPLAAPEIPEAVVEQPFSIPVNTPPTAAELPEPDFAVTPFQLQLLDIGELSQPTEEINAEPVDVEPSRVLSFLRRLPLPDSSRPGLSVVLGLVAVAALFSAGAWWGMQVHGRTAATKTVAAKTDNSPQSVTTPSAPSAEILSPAPAVSDNLMNPAKLDSDPTPLTPVAGNKLAGLPKITGIRHWSSSMGSTVVIDMEDQVPYEVHRLMSPERIYFDLHDTVLSSELDGKTMDVGDTSLTRVRIAQPVAGVTRVVLDTKDGSNFSVSMESNPYRLVVELRGSEKSLSANQFSPNHAIPSRMQASVNVAPAPVKTAPVAALAAKVSDQPVPARTGKFRIVLDAGHGGWDLGTVGRQGLLEKDLVLDVTQRLGKLLQARLGLDVMFTRTSDTYLPLDQRADIANQAQADLFVSVHANYSSSAAARGVETYYTNLFSAPGSKEVEKHDDGTFSKLTPVSLSAVGLHEKIQESQRLAASVQRSLYATLAATSPDIRNRGIKDSAFAVLTGTTMPAILTEISFVSSPADEHSLQNAAYRQQIAEALYQGIARYEQSSPRTKIAQLQTSARR